MERRNRHPESWLWETEDGRQWLIRLVVATLYTFGLKRDVAILSRTHGDTELTQQTRCVR